MFNGSFCESEKDPEIPDVSPAAFKALLRYCYYEFLDIKDDTSLSVLYASTKYMLPLLEEAARRKLIQILRGSNVWDVYKYAINVGDTKLLEACHMFFQGNITSVKEALQAEAFLNIPHKVLLDLLHINDEVDNVASLNNNPVNDVESKGDSSKTDRSEDKKIDIVDYKNDIGISISEIEVFKACNTWAEAECLRQEIEPNGGNKRTVLGEGLFLIRFPTMLHKDLATIVYPAGILTQSEIVNLGLYIFQGAGSECQVDFPSRERQFVVTTPEMSDTVPSISTVSIEAEVTVALCRLWTTGRGSYKVTLRDLTSDLTWSMKSDTKFQGHGTKVINKSRVILHSIDIKPQLLEAGTKYSITAELIKLSDPPDQKLVTNWVCMEDLLPFKEVKITCDPTENNSIYALTLCLV